jgi:hypothetical protein
VGGGGVTLPLLQGPAENTSITTTSHYITLHNICGYDYSYPKCCAQGQRLNRADLQLAYLSLSLSSRSILWGGAVPLQLPRLPAGRSGTAQLRPLPHFLRLHSGAGGLRLRGPRAVRQRGPPCQVCLLVHLSN